MRQDYIEVACEVMHDAYEAAAVGAGWETQERSRKPWSEVPEANKATMRAAVSALLDWQGTWEPGRWWRVLSPDGSLWCETSDEDEARADAVKPGYRLQRLWQSTPQSEWRDVT